jgi:DNA repair protein RadC
VVAAVPRNQQVSKVAISFSAASIALVHNHPSGDPEPSPEDIATTKRLAEAGKILGITLLDHVVIGDGQWVSLKQRGLM